MAKHGKPQPCQPTLPELAKLLREKLWKSKTAATNFTMIKHCLSNLATA